jgi:hypothetical protein
LVNFFLTFFSHVSEVAVSSVVNFSQAFEAIIFVSTEGGKLFNQHALKGVAVFEAVTLIRVAGRSFWSSCLNSVGKHRRATIPAVTRLTTVDFLLWNEVLG